jgi:hypothetical protein
VTALIEFNGREEISPHLNVIPKVDPREMKEELSSAVEFPLKKKITKPNRISIKNNSPILGIMEISLP